MKYLRYTGEFVSVAGNTWRADILQEAEKEFTNVGQLEFDAQPLVIEWAEKPKEAVICGAVATLRIVSPGDRTFTDLYSVEPGRVSLNIYRNNLPYWSGTIDTEFYEEPYEQLNGYIVTLTFSDFGILDRLKYELGGLLTIDAVVKNCLQRSGINYTGINQELISTEITPGTRLKLADLKVSSDNFYDEDGEASTLAEVIEGVLQPLALKIVQRAGVIYIYDINGLCQTTAAPITWDGATQTMGTDHVYNNAKITWSTYARAGNLLPDKCWKPDIKTDPNKIALNEQYGIATPDNRAVYYSYSLARKPADFWDDGQCAFTIWASDEGENIELGPKPEVGDGAKFFKIVPQNDGDKCEGVAVSFCSAKYQMMGKLFYIWPTGVGYLDRSELHTAGVPGNLIFKTKSVFVPSVEQPAALALRLKQDVLIDWRFNPYEEPLTCIEGWNEAKIKARVDQIINFVYIPVVITYKPAGGNTTYVWDNREIVHRDVAAQVRTLSATMGKWVEYTEVGGQPAAWGYLAYYNPEDRREKAGIMGWQSNRSAINPYAEDITAQFIKSDPGQYISFPDQGIAGGMLQISVYTGAWRMNDGGRPFDATDYDPDGLWQSARWLLMKLPQIEIINNFMFDQTINTDDVEYNATLNASAKEEITIDTICGTAKEGVPTARGAYYLADGRQLKELTRAGCTSQVEELLINTIYSQYAARCIVLSGEAVISSGEITAYSEANQGAKKFMLTEDIQDVRLECSDAKYIEIRPDEYTKK